MNRQLNMDLVVLSIVGIILFPAIAHAERKMDWIDSRYRDPKIRIFIVSFKDGASVKETNKIIEHLGIYLGPYSCDKKKIRIGLSKKMTVDRAWDYLMNNLHVEFYGQEYGKCDKQGMLLNP